MWNKLRNNFLCDEKEALRINQIHLEKLINTKTHIDNKRPITPLFFRNKTILKESIREKERKINLGNNIIYTRLSSVKIFYLHILNQEIFHNIVQLLTKRNSILLKKKSKEQSHVKIFFF